MLSIIRRTYPSACGVAGSRICVAPSEDENSFGLVSTDSTSACRSTSQNPGPSGQPRTGISATHATGAA